MKKQKASAGKAIGPVVLGTAIPSAAASEGMVRPRLEAATVCEGQANGKARAACRPPLRRGAGH